MFCVAEKNLKQLYLLRDKSGNSQAILFSWNAGNSSSKPASWSNKGGACLQAFDVGCKILNLILHLKTFILSPVMHCGNYVRLTFYSTTLQEDAMGAQSRETVWIPRASAMRDGCRLSYDTECGFSCFYAPCAFRVSRRCGQRCWTCPVLSLYRKMVYLHFLPERSTEREGAAVGAPSAGCKPNCR